MLTLTGIDEVKAQLGQELGVSDWHEVTQDEINNFADVTGDHQWIHVDVERANETPFGGTIAHGYYTLSLAPMLSDQTFKLDGVAMVVNYGLNKVRFPSPVPVGGRVRASATLDEATPFEGGVQMNLKVTIEVEGREKPAMVGSILFRRYV